MSQKVLRFTQDAIAARGEVARLGGRILHQFSPTAFVAELPDAVNLATLTGSTAQATQPPRLGPAHAQRRRACPGRRKAKPYRTNATAVRQRNVTHHGLDHQAIPFSPE